MIKWNKDNIKKHKETADLLHKVVQKSFEFVGKSKNTTEKNLQKFILKKFDDYGLETEKNRSPIVAFGKNSALPHYQPGRNSKKLKPETFILLDIWARLKEKGSPYADITWVGYYGEGLPKKIKKIFYLVLKARDLTVSLIKSELKKKKIPTGREIHEKICNFFIQKGYRENILHGTGHIIGFRSPHGMGHKSYLNKKGREKLLTNVGYTIEPGLYFENKFGIRSEIDFYVDENKKLYITTQVQEEIIMIKPR